MPDMAPLFSLFAVIPVLLGGFYFYAHQRTFGNLDISTTDVAYDRAQYHDILDWDKYSFIIDGEPTQIHSGEFHYWRVPDRERWEPILKQYRAAGLNTIRIYFHWGYHSPNEGVYLFDGNRDIEYLLSLCEKLNLYVLAAPGPYICAETAAGGYPGWLVAKRDLNIRHNYIMLWRVYDKNYANYEIEWLNHILPIIGNHQITNKQRGCVIGLQLENELFETMANMLPVGLHDQMRVLAKAARDIGITVPLFSNDGFEEGGWVPRPELDTGKKKFWQRNRFGMDLYGFDKYVIFAPSSSPKSWLINSGVSVGSWDEWNPKNMERSMDKLEKTVRGFGGGAKDSPIFIPELQGGWFNHYQLQHTYDQIFDYYGDEYTKLLEETAMAQGITAISLYMVYGGTNWGTLGDPDVYTSYDYSACIREFGMLSSRGRNLRKTILLTRSFDPYFTRTERVSQPNIKTSIPHTFNLQRYAVADDQQVTFTFFRNFDRKKRTTFDVTIDDQVTLGCYLPYKSSFIGIGNYTAKNGVHLLLSTVPILTRLTHDNHEVWVVETNVIGGMAFSARDMEVTGTLQEPALRPDGPASILTFKQESGWTRIETADGDLTIIGLDKYNAGTLFAEFEEPFWNKGVKKYPAFAAWGADNFFFSDGKLEINHRENEPDARVISFEPIKDKRWVQDADLPFVYKYDYQFNAVGDITIHPTHWEHRAVKLDHLDWTKIRAFKKNGSLSFDTIDYQYLSGHVLYRQQFKTPSKEHPHVTLSLNARNRATVLVNGKVIGGHTTYSRQLFMPGAKIGPDPYFLGTHTYDLSPYLSRTDGLDNEVVVIVESFGLCRQAFIMNDVRNPRGIVSAKIKGLDQDTNGWEIAGVDVRDLSNPYSSTGFPDEHVESGWTPLTVDGGVPISVDQGAQWYRFRFDNPLKKKSQYVPLRLHMDGEWSAMVILNDVLIARFYGNGDGPQHDFYLPDELIKSKNNVVKILAYTWKDTVGHLEIKGWPVLPDSGNLITHGEGKDYATYHEQTVLF